MTRYCADFDDLTDANASGTLETLAALHLKYPNFKATLFTIPKRTSGSVIAAAKQVGDGWLQLAPHGWRHTRGECLSWTDEEAESKIQLARNMGIDAPIFKAPAWLIDGDTYVACERLNYAVAVHKDFRVPDSDTREYIYNDPNGAVYGIHGHLTDCEGNFILTMLEDGKLNFDADDEFVWPQDVAKVYR